MFCSAVVVGIGNWEKYTKPCIDSLRQSLPGVHVVLIDNGSDPAYPNNYADHTVRLVDTVSYPAALNFGLLAAPKSDWYMPMNNDIVFTKRMKHFDSLSRDKLHGFVTHFVNDRPYLQGSCYFLSSKILQDVGLFDDNILPPMWFDDVDYSWRVVEAGYELSLLDPKDMGFWHAEEERDEERHLFRKQHYAAWEHNRDYVLRKHHVI